MRKQSEVPSCPSKLIIRVPASIFALLTIGLNDGTAGVCSFPDFLTVGFDTICMTCLRLLIADTTILQRRICCCLVNISHSDCGIWHYRIEWELLAYKARQT